MEWSKLTKLQLEKLYREKSCDGIGAMFGKAPETVRHKLIKLGVERNPRGGRRSFNPGKEELETLYQGKTISNLAEMYGVGETVVWKRLKEHGIVLRGFERGGHRMKPGRKLSASHLEKIRKAGKRRRGKWAGENNPNWKGGLSIVNKQLRQSGAYQEWKRRALERAGYKCEECEVEQGKTCECCGMKISLHVHHKRSFAKFPEDRFNPENSEVVCLKCHRSRHS